MVLPVKAVIALSTGGLIIAQLPAVPLPAVDAIGRISLDAALVAAVIALWRAVGQKDIRIAEKDAQIIAMATKVTETMVSVLDAVKELRGAVNDLKTSRRQGQQG